MIFIEEILPHDTFLKWEDYKSELKKNKKKVTLDAFTILFGEKITKEENANLLDKNQIMIEKGEIIKHE